MLSAGVRHSEKSNSTGCRLAGCGSQRADVLGFDVAMGDAFGLRVVRRFDQLFAEALQHVERQAPSSLGFCHRAAFSGALEQQRRAAGDREKSRGGRRCSGDAAARDFALCGRSRSLCATSHATLRKDASSSLPSRRTSNVAGEPRPCALMTVKPPPPGDRPRWRRWGRPWLPGRGGEFVLDAIQVIEEALNRVVAGEHVGAGGELDQFLLPRAAAVHHVDRRRPWPARSFSARSSTDSAGAGR